MNHRHTAAAAVLLTLGAAVAVPTVAAAGDNAPYCQYDAEANWVGVFGVQGQAKRRKSDVSVIRLSDGHVWNKRGIRAHHGERTASFTIAPPKGDGWSQQDFAVVMNGHTCEGS